MSDESELARLSRETLRFQMWVQERYGEQPRFGEWETWYEDWLEIYATVEAFVQAVSHTEWNSDTVATILYLLARDNECERVVELVAEDPERLLFLARAGLQSSESDARWQLADRLGELGERRDEAEDILVAFARDNDEYVRRQALMALGRLGSSQVDTIAREVWESEVEHARIAVLSVLHEVGSPMLGEYMSQAEADGRPYLLAQVAAIRSKGDR